MVSGEHPDPLGLPGPFTGSFPASPPVTSLGSEHALPWVRLSHGEGGGGGPGVHIFDEFPPDSETRGRAPFHEAAVTLLLVTAPLPASASLGDLLPLRPSSGRSPRGLSWSRPRLSPRCQGEVTAPFARPGQVFRGRVRPSPPLPVWMMWEPHTIVFAFLASWGLPRPWPLRSHTQHGRSTGQLPGGAAFTLE